MKKVLTFVLLFAMVFSLAACQTTTPAENEDTNTAETKATETKATDEAPAETVEITYWMAMSANTALVATEMGDTEYSKALQEMTGIDIKYIHPPVGQDKDAFSILVASGDYPDIIEYKWIKYPGGPVSAINNEVIIELNDLIENNSPNLKAMLEENPDIDKMIRTDDGKYYVYPFLRGTTQVNNKLIFSEGFAIRKDYLDALEMEVPETPEEWYTMLTRFKDELDVELPMTIRKDVDHISRVLAPGFDSWHDFYLEDDVVTHGFIQENRRAYLTEANKWYSEGLLDSEYLAVDKKTQASKVLNGQVGATYAPGGSGLGAWITAFKELDPTVDFVSAPPMSSVKGQVAKFSKMNTIYTESGTSAAISTGCENVEAAAKLLDFAYGEEGHLLNNFGIEGVSYNMVDGYPTYTDLILNNPDGLSVTEAMGMYIRGHVSGPLVQDERELEQYYSLKQQQDALVLWTQTDMAAHLMPPVSASTEESEELAQIMNNVNTYREEMETKFITGVAPLTEFDAYVEQLKAFGIERAIEIMQACYDRYMAR